MLESGIITVVALTLFVLLVQFIMRRDERDARRSRDRVTNISFQQMNADHQSCAWCKHAIGDSPDGRHCADCVEKLAV